MNFRSTIVFCICLSGVLHADDKLSNDLQLGGFLSAGYLESSHYNFLAATDGGTTSFMEMGVNASWTAKDRMTINGQLFAFELGSYGNFDLLVDYLFLDYNVQREFGVRIGRIKREVGIHYHVQDIDLSRTSVLLPIGVYDQRFRDISAFLDGASIYGNLDLWDGAYLDYLAYGGYFTIEPDGGVAGYALSELSREANNVAIEQVDSEYNYGVQFWLSPGLEGLRIGVGSTYFPEMSAILTGNLPPTFPIPPLANAPLEIQMNGFDMSISQASLEYYIGTWNFAAEYALTRTNHNHLASALGMPIEMEERLHEETAWYVSASKRMGRFEAAVIYVDNRNSEDNLTVVSPSSKVSIDRQFSLRYDVTDFWTLKAEVHSIEGTKQLFNQLDQNPVLDQRNWTLFAAKSTIYF